jgi:hypothetical protein
MIYPIDLEGYRHDVPNTDGVISRTLPLNNVTLPRVVFKYVPKYFLVVDITYERPPF